MGELPLYVRCPQMADPLCVSVPGDSTVGFLKLAIEDAGGPHAHRVLLRMPGGGELLDAAELADCGLGAEQLIEAELRPPATCRCFALDSMGKGRCVLDNGTAATLWPCTVYNKKWELCPEVEGGIAGVAGRAFLLADGTLSGHAAAQGNALAKGRRILDVAANRFSEYVAILEDGGVIAWGGDGESAYCDIVDFRTVATQVSRGKRHCVAVLEDGSVHTWGSPQQAAVPGELRGRRAVSVAAGDYGSAAVFEDGGLVTWPGQLPDYVQSRLDAVGAVVVSAFGNAFAALLKDGAVVRWKDSASARQDVFIHFDAVVLLLPDTVQDKRVVNLCDQFAVLADGALVHWVDGSALSRPPGRLLFYNAHGLELREREPAGPPAGSGASPAPSAAAEPYPPAAFSAEE